MYFGRCSLDGHDACAAVTEGVASSAVGKTEVRGQFHQPALEPRAHVKAPSLQPRQLR